MHSPFLFFLSFSSFSSLQPRGRAIIARDVPHVVTIPIHTIHSEEHGLFVRSISQLHDDTLLVCYQYRIRDFCLVKQFSLTGECLLCFSIPYRLNVTPIQLNDDILVCSSTKYPFVILVSLSTQRCVGSIGGYDCALRSIIKLSSQPDVLVTASKRCVLFWRTTEASGLERSTTTEDFDHFSSLVELVTRLDYPKDITSNLRELEEGMIAFCLGDTLEIVSCKTMKSWTTIKRIHKGVIQCVTQLRRNVLVLSAPRSGTIVVNIKKRQTLFKCRRAFQTIMYTKDTFLASTSQTGNYVEGFNDKGENWIYMSIRGWSYLETLRDGKVAVAVNGKVLFFDIKKR